MSELTIVRTKEISIEVASLLDCFLELEQSSLASILSPDKS